MCKLESIEHDYPKILKSQSYKQCPVSSERIVLDLESEVNQGPRFYSQ